MSFKVSGDKYDTFLELHSFDIPLCSSLQAKCLIWSQRGYQGPAMVSTGDDNLVEQGTALEFGLGDLVRGTAKSQDGLLAKRERKNASSPVGDHGARDWVVGDFQAEVAHLQRCEVDPFGALHMVRAF
ncbi:hypothetical protein Acr_01g0000580 [Actinidia rufa]|uniref:Uncharacterized protein n=1 Tax=Actinidia rufa TaxID=165716 RepID=A0A7J0E2U5_9ERIC|nr:hypothetical protein Acr_01g0000580 [Actinidia rufa]